MGCGSVNGGSDRLCYRERRVPRRRLLFNTTATFGYPESRNPRILGVFEIAGAEECT